MAKISDKYIVLLMRRIDNDHPLTRFARESGKSLSRIADDLMMNYSTLSRIASGRGKPSRNTAIRLKRYSGGCLDVDELVNWPLVND